MEIGAGRTLTTNRDFTQGAAGTLAIALGGTGANDFGKVAVNGAATLGGTLTISLATGFVPDIGDTFQIMTFTSGSGSFATVNGLNIGGGKLLEITVGATGITIEVVSA